MKIFVLVCIIGFLISPSAMADIDQTVSFSYTNPSQGGLVASGTLVFDVTTGQLLSGTGTVASSLIVGPTGAPLGPQSMFLATLTTPLLPQGFDTPIRNVGDYGPGTFMYVDSDGTDLYPVDTSFSWSAPYVDSNGIAFAWGAPNSNGYYGSLNIWSQGGGWVDFLGHGGPAGLGQIWTYSSGTLTVPVPDGGMTLTLLGGALVGIETVRRRFRV